MLETELKASLAGLSAGAVAERAEALGFRPAARRWERDVYYNGSSRDFARTDEALRLRRVRNLPDGPEESFLTYKGPKLDGVSSARTEYETAVADGETAGKLLEALGYRPAAAVEKCRREYRRDDVTLCLDAVTGLGDYLELEILLPPDGRRDDAVARLLDLLDRLGVSRDRLTRQSYLELLERRSEL